MKGDDTTSRSDSKVTDDQEIKIRVTPSVNKKQKLFSQEGTEVLL